MLLVISISLLLMPKIHLKSVLVMHISVSWVYATTLVMQSLLRVALAVLD